MTKLISLKRTALLLFSVTFLAGTTVSCKNEPEAKEAAEEINDDRIESDSKEDDAEFLVDAASLDLKEIELGKLAQNSTNKTVADHGKLMVDEHTKSFNEIKMLAEQKGIVVPMSIATEEIDDYKDLSDKKGADFDKKYLNILVDKHEKAVKKYEDYIEDSKDQEIKSWASKNLTALRTHLDHSKQLHENHK